MINLINQFKKAKKDQSKKAISKKNIAIALSKGAIIVLILVLISGGSISVEYRENDKKNEIERNIDIRINAPQTDNKERLD